MKKLLSLFLALSCIMSVFTQAAAALSSEPETIVPLQEQEARNQLAEGEMADFDAVMEIFEEYEDASLQNEGITACIDDESGCIQITQFSGGNSIIRSGQMPEIICTSILLSDAEGNIVHAREAYQYQEIEAGTDSIDSPAYKISATHTAYIMARTNGMGSLGLRLTRVVTSVGDLGVAGTTLEQTFEIARDSLTSIPGTSGVFYPSSNTKYTLRNNKDSNYYSPTSGSPCGFIRTFATFNINGTKFVLASGLLFNDWPEYGDPFSVPVTGGNHF